MQFEICIQATTTVIFQAYKQNYPVGKPFSQRTQRSASVSKSRTTSFVFEDPPHLCEAAVNNTSVSVRHHSSHNFSWCVDEHVKHQGSYSTTADCCIDFGGGVSHLCTLRTFHQPAADLNIIYMDWTFTPKAIVWWTSSFFFPLRWRCGSRTDGPSTSGRSWRRKVPRASRRRRATTTSTDGASPPSSPAPRTLTWSQRTKATVRPLTLLHRVPVWRTRGPTLFIK